MILYYETLPHTYDTILYRWYELRPKSCSVCHDLLIYVATSPSTDPSSSVSKMKFILRQAVSMYLVRYEIDLHHNAILHPWSIRRSLWLMCVLFIARRKMRNTYEVMGESATIWVQCISLAFTTWFSAVSTPSKSNDKNSVKIRIT